jgi:PRTRC genetic system protein E
MGEVVSVHSLENHMKFIAHFATLLAAGVSVQLKLAAHGENEIQLDIIPVAKTNKAGIVLTPKALIGTAQELDDNLPAFLDTYISTQSSINTLIEESERELAAAKAATDAAKSTSTKTASTQVRKAAPSGKPGAPAKVRDMSAGLMDDDDQGEGTDGEGAGSAEASGGGEPEELAEAGSATGDAQATTGGLDPALF